eukprot:jgi/Psemu1/38347/gm1.38347_g
MFTKPLQGSQFRKFRNTILGITKNDYLAYQKAFKAAKMARADHDWCYLKALRQPICFPSNRREDEGARVQRLPHLNTSMLLYWFANREWQSNGDQRLNNEPGYTAIKKAGLIPPASLKRHNGLGGEANAADARPRFRGTKTAAVFTFKHKPVPIQAWRGPHGGTSNNTIRTGNTPRSCGISTVKD